MPAQGRQHRQHRARTHRSRAATLFLKSSFLANKIRTRLCSQRVAPSNEKLQFLSNICRQGAKVCCAWCHEAEPRLCSPTRRLCLQNRPRKFILSSSASCSPPPFSEQTPRAAQPAANPAFHASNTNYVQCNEVTAQTKPLCPVQSGLFQAGIPKPDIHSNICW